MKRVVVIGGGLSGLAAARALADEAEARSVGLELTLLEREADLGGKARTKREGGFLSEAGPASFLDNKPAGLALARRLGLGGSLLKCETKNRKQYVFADGWLKLLPEAPGPFFMSDLLSLSGRARVAGEALVAAGDPREDESVGAFVRRRLGDEALEKLIEPVTAGVYAGDPDVLSLRSCFPKVAFLEDQFGGILKGLAALQAISASRKLEGGQTAEPGATLWSFEEGLGSLTQALAESLEGRSLRTGVSAESVVRREGGWRVVTSDGELLPADAVVLTTPAYESAALLGSTDPDLADLLYTIPYAPVAVVSTGYRAEDLRDPLEGSGFLVPRAEPCRLLSSRYDSSLFRDRAPEGHVLLTHTVGGARTPELAELGSEELIELVRDELAKALGITGALTYATVTRWPRAIPQYILGHAQRVKRAEARAARLNGVFLGGNAYHGVGMNDCVAQAGVLAPRVLDFVSASKAEG